ncbi:hypothetical protein DFJ74DRAFT_658517 [Hyaloraphidium curvatum]|nr:hypothetical protein DFJ74DRAFT_658517 [Hyaloraphidium curvatum]
MEGTETDESDAEAAVPIAASGPEPVEAAPASEAAPSGDGSGAKPASRKKRNAPQQRCPVQPVQEAEITVYSCPAPPPTRDPSEQLLVDDVLARVGTVLSRRGDMRTLANLASASREMHLRGLFGLYDRVDVADGRCADVVFVSNLFGSLARAVTVRPLFCHVRELKVAADLLPQVVETRNYLEGHLALCSMLKRAFAEAEQQVFASAEQGMAGAPSASKEDALDRMRKPLVDLVDVLTRAEDLATPLLAVLEVDLSAGPAKRSGSLDRLHHALSQLSCLDTVRTLRLLSPNKDALEAMRLPPKLELLHLKSPTGSPSQIDGFRAQLLAREGLRLVIEVDHKPRGPNPERDFWRGWGGAQWRQHGPGCKRSGGKDCTVCGSGKGKGKCK